MRNSKLGLVSAVTVLAIALAVTLSTSATITNGLVGRWMFNDGSGIIAHDSSGMGNDGTLYGSAGFDTDLKRGGVLDIYNVSGEVDMPFTTTLQPAVGTVMVWVKPTLAKTADIVRQDTDMLVRINNTGLYYAYCLRVTDKGAPVAIIANDDPTSKYPQTVIQGPAGIKLNQWAHIAMRWDGRTLSLFLNGKRVSSTPYNANPSTGLSYHGTLPVKVAAAIWNFNDGYLDYVGSVSDVRVYNRAMSDTEIASVYAGN